MCLQKVVLRFYCISVQNSFSKNIDFRLFDANSGFSSPNKTIISSEFSLMCCTRFVIILRRKLQNSTYLITKMMFIQLVLSRECGTREKKEKSFLKLFYIGDNSAKIVHHKICPSLNERLN